MEPDRPGLTSRVGLPLSCCARYLISLGAVGLSKIMHVKHNARCWPIAGSWIAGDYYFTPQKAVKSIIELLKKEKVKAVLDDKSKVKDSMFKKRESKNLVYLNVHKYKETTHTCRASNVIQESNRNGGLCEKGHRVSRGQDGLTVHFII